MFLAVDGYGDCLVEKKLLAYIKDGNNISRNSFY